MKSDKRCPWCLGSPEYIAYHDREWGRPVHDDRVLFEFLVLEGAQAGLSWSTILRKRENYRALFAQFDPAKVARFSQARVEKILLDPGIGSAEVPGAGGGVVPRVAPLSVVSCGEMPDEDDALCGRPRLAAGATS